MKRSPPSLTLMRHGPADIPAGCCIGQLNCPLSHMGEALVTAQAKRWPADGVTHIYTSDLDRARKTAQLLADEAKLTITVDARLREIDFGTWEGKHWDDLHHADPQHLARWGANWVHTRPPQGENVADLYKRVSEFYQEIRLLPPEETLIVAHAGSLRALACHLTSSPLEHLFDFDFLHATPLCLI